MKSKEVLSVQGVSVAYDRKRVVSDVSFSIGAGRIFGLAGLNGAGKTTLIKAVLGLRDHDGGDIKLFDKSTSFSESRVGVSYLPERFTPPWFLTGIEFIRFSVSLYRTDFTDDEIYEMSEALALSPDVLKKRVETYSKGMKQKLGIVATLLSNCPLLILDEPMSGLDPQARVYVKRSLQAAAQQDRAIFLSSHILADMEEICDSIGVLHEGKILYTGTPGAFNKEHKVKNMEQAFLSVIEGHGC